MYLSLYNFLLTPNCQYFWNIPWALNRHTTSPTSWGTLRVEYRRISTPQNRGGYKIYSRGWRLFKELFSGGMNLREGAIFIRRAMRVYFFSPSTEHFLPSPHFKLIFFVHFRRIIYYFIHNCKSGNLPLLDSGGGEWGRATPWIRLCLSNLCRKRESGIPKIIEREECLLKFLLHCLDKTNLVSEYNKPVIHSSIYPSIYHPSFHPSIHPSIHP